MSPQKGGFHKCVGAGFIALRLLRPNRLFNDNKAEVLLDELDHIICKDTLETVYNSLNFSRENNLKQ